MLYCIMGPSGVGKDTICNNVKVVTKMNGFEVRPIINITTRPIREGEEDGKDYYFTSNALFEKLKDSGDLVAPRMYKVANGEIWQYATFKSDLINVKNNEDYVFLTVASPTQFNGFFDCIKGSVIPIILYAPKLTTLKRMIDRVSRSDYDNQEVIDEIIRRFRYDEDYKGDYHTDPMLSRLTITNDSVEGCTNKIVNAITAFENSNPLTQSTKFTLAGNKPVTVKQLYSPDTFKAFRDEE